MNFGPTPLDHAEGALLAHSLRRGDVNFKKGRRLSAEDIEQLRALGVEEIIAAKLEPDDVHEDEAARLLAEAINGANLGTSAAFTGRANLVCQAHGVLQVDRDRLDRINLVHESITIATLAPFEVVAPRQMAATVKIIPFSVPGDRLEACLEIARDGGPLLTLHPFQRFKVGLVQTKLGATKTSVLDKTREAIDTRLENLGCSRSEERRVGHDPTEVADALAELKAAGCEMLLISGASAIVDRADVVPTAIEQAGGEIEHFGMPVDPGNLILLARDGDRPVLGLPGCARSPKVNGFDWVLERLVAGIKVMPRDIMLMGAGGLLKETTARPLPRAKAVAESEGETDSTAAPQEPRIAALLLAAGQSRRMGETNKLLAEVGGKPLVRHAAEAALASKATPVVAVVGHESDGIRAALEGLNLNVVDNPDYDAGLSASLRKGIAELPSDVDGVVVLLGDMPAIGADVIDRLIAAFNPVEGRAICIPTWRGKRGNPVLLAGEFFDEMQEIRGDVGAKAIIARHDEAVCEIEVADGSVLRDIDTPEELRSLQDQDSGG